MYKLTEALKTVLINYVVCALVGGVLEYIAPEKARGALRVAVVSVLLLGIVIPFAGNGFDFDCLLPDESVQEEVSYDALMHTSNLAERKIRNEMKEILINEEVGEYEIYVSTSVDLTENTVYLDEIKIEVGKAFSDKIAEIENKVSEEYREILKVGVKND